MNLELSQNHFELFELPVTFEIDQQQLADRYRQLQRSVHPDRFANAPDRQRRLSVQRAAQINEAFQTLKSELKRARYLLQLQGVELNDEQGTIQDADFLLEQMTLRESLGAVAESKEPLSQLAQVVADINRRASKLVKELHTLFSEDSKDNKEQARLNVQKLQFMERLQEEAGNIEEDLYDST